MPAMTTGQLAAALGTTEARLQELIRYGKLSRPPKVRGKRQWPKKNQDEARIALERNS